MYIINFQSKNTINNLEFNPNNFINLNIQFSCKIKIKDNRLDTSSIETGGGIDNVLKSIGYNDLKPFRIMAGLSFFENKVSCNFKHSADVIYNILQKADFFKNKKHILIDNYAKFLSKKVVQSFSNKMNFRLKIIDVADIMHPSYFLLIDYSKNFIKINALKTHDSEFISNFDTFYYSALKIDCPSIGLWFNHFHPIDVPKIVYLPMTIYRYLILLKMNDEKIVEIQKFKKSKKELVKNLYKNLSNTLKYLSLYQALYNRRN
jgi:hypothetical protein